MIANYGYKDGSGEYYISIDTDKCVSCKKKKCVTACHESVFEVFKDDYDNEVVGVKGEQRNKLKHTCASCKPTGGAHNLPCQRECTPGAIVHSW